MKQANSLFTALFLLMLSSCSQKVLPVSGGSEMLYASQWKLATVNGKAVPSGKAHLLFYPGAVSRIAGNAGCNNISGTMELSGEHRLKFSPLASTRMACEPAVREAEFLAALAKVDNWTIIDNKLYLRNKKRVMATLNATTVETSPLTGTWELNYISGNRIAFEGLYPDKKPQINFDRAPAEVGGNTSCNGFSSKMTVEGNKIYIAEPYVKTMIFCEGGGESSFLNMLKKVNRYALTDAGTLTFMIDDVAVMRFTRINGAKG